MPKNDQQNQTPPPAAPADPARAEALAKIRESGADLAGLKLLMGADSESEVINAIAAQIRLTRAEKALVPIYRRVAIKFRAAHEDVKDRAIAIPAKLVATKHSHSSPVETYDEVTESTETKVVLNVPITFKAGDTVELDADQHLLHWLRHNLFCELKVIEQGKGHGEDQYQPPRVVKSDFQPGTPVGAGRPTTQLSNRAMGLPPEASESGKAESGRAEK